MAVVPNMSDLVFQVLPGMSSNPPNMCELANQKKKDVSSGIIPHVFVDDVLAYAKRTYCPV
jgi:hypothetical protein